MLLVACWPQRRPQTSVGGHWPGRKLRPDLPPNAKGPSPAQRAYPGRPGKHVKPTHNGTQTQQRGCAARAAPTHSGAQTPTCWGLAFC